MLKKESKIKILEGFYGLDYVFFGKQLKNMKSCCPVIKEEYISLKGALLSVYLEMLKLMEYTPKVIEEKVTSKMLMLMAKESAKVSREASKQIVTTQKARKDIIGEMKQELKNDKSINVTDLVERKIREKAFRLAVDNLLVADALVEAKNLDNMNDWTGRVVEDSYKILRDNLCETAMMILDGKED